MRALLTQLRLRDDIRRQLLPFRRREVLGRWSLRSTPSSLSHEKPTADGACVDLAALLVDDQLLRLDDRAWFALVVHTEDFGAQLEFAAFRGCGEGFEELDETLAVDDALGVEFGDVGDGRCGLRGVEVNYFLGGAFEGEDDRVRREDGEFRVKFL